MAVKAFTSAPDVGARWFPWVPVRWIMRTRFANLDKIGAIKTPVFIAHGTQDEVVPYEHGERLFEAAADRKAFHKLPGHRHNDPLPAEFFHDLRAFLERHPATD